MTARTPSQAWTATEPQGVTFVELFFDLVFVFAVTSITRLLLEDLDWSGVGRAALILWLVWWAWTQFTWTLNPADTNHPSVRLVTLAAAAVAFFMAQAIPDAYTSAGAWFAFSYVIVRMLGLGLQLRLQAGTRENARAFYAWIGGSVFGLAAVVVGGLVDSPGREIFWGAAVALDVLAAARAGRGQWRIHAAHFAERHGLIVIIALGESLIAGGVALSGLDRDGAFAVGTIAAVAAVCALWWIYFGLAKETMEEHLEATSLEDSGRVARDVYSFGHLPIIAGVIGMAVGIEDVLAHADEALGGEALVALILGVCLYLGGVAFGVYRSGRRSLAPWLAAAAVAIVVVAAAAQASTGLVALVAVAVVLAGFAVWQDRAISA